LAIETDAGLRTVRVVGDDLASCAEVTVEMGRVVVGPTRTLDLAGVRFDVTAASAGNPHAVTFASLDDRTLDVIGAALQGSPQFPAGVNLERVAGVARDGEGRIGARVDVFERGVGRTMAVIVAKGRARVDEEITITLAGGRLAIAIDERGVATMRGAARRSFWGEIATSGVVEGSA
jgi:diaminopimelate epimerase